MAIVVYQCDVCKRQIQLMRNIKGLECINRCTITHGCRGKLYQVSLHPDYIRGQIADDVPGLDNWIPRRVLFNFTQAIRRDTWVITHNMGTAPIVSVFVDHPTENNPNNREEITPVDIVYTSEDVVTLKFDAPYSGIAQLVGRQSDPNLLQPYERSSETTTEPLQISSNGEITIATLATKEDNTTINITIQYDTAVGATPQLVYEIDNQPSLNSAWVDSNRVVFKGKVYNVRSFNGLVPQMANGEINSGSNLFFTAVSWDNTPTTTTIKTNEILILLASSPFETVDKISNQFIDVSTITPTKNTFALFYNSGEFYVDPSNIQSVYPPIRKI